MIISLNRPITGFDKKYSFATLASLLALIATLIIVSEAYRIFMKSSDLLFFLRTSEDFFLIFIIFFMIALKGRLQLQNLVPFSFLMIYGYLSFSLDYDTDFLRQYALFMFWYTVAINTIYGTKSSY